MGNKKLAEAAKAEDAAALMDLWESVRRVCIRIARRYSTMLTRAGLDTEDIAQELFLAYHAALMAFDPSGEYKFTTFLTYHVKNSLRAVLGIRRGSRELPPVPVSLDCPLGDETDNIMGDLVPDPEATRAFTDAESRVWNEQLHSALERCLDSIDEQPAAIIRGRFFGGLTRETLAKQAGISAACAQQLERKGIRQLRHGANVKRLKQYREEINTGIYHGTGFNAWRYGGSSVEEKIVSKVGRDGIEP